MALGPLYAEFLFNRGGFELPFFVASLLMIVLFMITYTMMSDVVETAATDDEDGSAIEELDEKPRIKFSELFRYKVSP